jgi:hypothetical protein
MRTTDDRMEMGISLSTAAWARGDAPPQRRLLIQALSTPGDTPWSRIKEAAFAIEQKYGSGREGQRKKDPSSRGVG